jgi:hypothetical protein
MPVEIVIAEFAADKEDDQEAHGHAYSEAQYIDQCKSLPFEEAPDRDFQIVSEHTVKFIVLTGIDETAYPYFGSEIKKVDP